MPDAAKPLRIFLSYAHADVVAVRKLYKYLREKDLDVWFNVESLLPGQDWRLEIEKALNAADIIIVCLSPLTVSREGFAQKEIRVALERGMEMPEGRIFLIPVRLQDCDVPTSLGRYQWVDLFENEGLQLLLRSLDFCAKQLGRTGIDEGSQSAILANPDGMVGPSISVGGDVSKSTIIIGNNNIIHISAPPTA